jgi:hypothetical protein
MQIVVALVVIWFLFVVLSWVLHAVKLLLIIAIIASLAVVTAKILTAADPLAGIRWPATASQDAFLIAVSREGDFSIDDPFTPCSVVH